MVEIIERIYTHWQHNPVKKNDDRWWQIIRDYDAPCHSQCAEQMAEVIRDGYHHPTYSVLDCISVCEQHIQACADPQWNFIMGKNKTWFGVSHPYKTIQWKFWRMVCEVMTNNKPQPKDELFDWEGAK